VPKGRETPRGPCSHRHRHQNPLWIQKEKFFAVFSDGSFNTSDAAFGFKISPAGTLLVTFNVIVKLNSGGLRGRVAPLVGLSYTP
jgi:hypothetical protein